MSEQPDTYKNLEKLKAALIEERRMTVAGWIENKGFASTTAEKIRNIQELLVSVEAAMKEERRAQGIAGFI